MARRALITILAATSVLLILFLFQKRTVNWWDRPKLGDEIVAIEIYEGAFRFPESKPTVVLDAESGAGSHILRALEESRRYRRVVKFSPYYSVDIVYENETKESICIGSSLISLGSANGGGDKVYQSNTSIIQIIENAINENPRMNPRANQQR